MIQMHLLMLRHDLIAMYGEKSIYFAICNEYHFCQDVYKCMNLCYAHRKLLFHLLHTVDLKVQVE